MRSTVQGRDQMMYATLAGTRDGKITALRCHQLRQPGRLSFDHRAGRGDGHGGPHA